MKRYIAKLVFRIICGEGTHTPQFDEQMRLIYAADESAAFRKAYEIGLQEQEEFPNHHNEVVQWKFIDVPEIYDLHSLEDGVEICSRVHENNQYKNYIDLVHHKADEIRARIEDAAVETA